MTAPLPNPDSPAEVAKYLAGFVERGKERARHLVPEGPYPWETVAPATSPKPALKTRTQAVKDHLAENGVCRTAAVAEGVGVGRSSAHRSLSWLRERGIVELTLKGWRLADG